MTPADSRRPRLPGRPAPSRRAATHQAARHQAAGRQARARTPARLPLAPPGACPTCRPCRRSWSRPARSRRSRRESAGPAAAVPATGRHAGLTTIPHGAKSFLGAALRRRPASGSCGSPATPRSATGWPRSSAPGSAIPESVAVLEPRTALAYERSELVADETAARVAALAAWRSGAARVLVASVQALLQHTIAPADLPAEPRRLQARRPARSSTFPARAARPRLPAGDRGRRPRGVRPARRHRRRVPARLGPARPDRAVRRRGRVAPQLRPDRPADDRPDHGDRAAAGDASS